MTVDHEAKDLASPSSPLSGTAPDSDIQLEILSSSCASNTCPTIYRSDRGTVVVQGYTISGSRAGVDLPDGEQLVEIPAELLAQAARLVT